MTFWPDTTSRAGAEMRKAGRFAPSPTGPLHLGSLYTALASFLDARSRNHQWLVRMDDLDKPRVVPQAESGILRTLESHGLHWDGSVRRQSTRVDAYERAIGAMRTRDVLYYCTCSRRDLRGLPVYPGTCRAQTEPIKGAAMRVRVTNAAPRFVDVVRGEQIIPLAQAVGDFIVKRRDGIISYQLATALDDSEPEIARVVRGGDLLDNTPRQLHLMTLCERRRPRYAHLGLLVNEAGRKLSKQTGAQTVSPSTPLANIRICLKLLGLGPLPDADLNTLLHWAIGAWDITGVPCVDQVIDSHSPR